MKRINLIVGIFLLVLFCACNGASNVPRPRGYLRTDFPEKRYRVFDVSGFPYRFECPEYATITADTQSFNYDPYWINLQLPRYNATIHISHKKVQKNLPELLNDTHNFVYRHVIKAEAISEMPYLNDEQKVYGMLYELDGNVASSVQFYTTDSTRNFLRGALYFSATPNADSLAPSIAFLVKDIQHLMETLEWK